MSPGMGRIPADSDLLSDMRACFDKKAARLRKVGGRELKRLQGETGIEFDDVTRGEVFFGQRAGVGTDGNARRDHLETG